MIRESGVGIRTFCFTVWVGAALLNAYAPYDPPPPWLWAAGPALFAVLTSVFVWRQSGATGGSLRTVVGTRVWVWYLRTGAVLAVTRVVLFVWAVDQQRNDIYTETNTFIVHWLYPEHVVSLFWRSLVGYQDTEYYVAYCSLFAIGCFVMATPILLVSWLRHKPTT